MSEGLGSLGTGDAAQTFSDVVSSIKSDMEAIEASAKNIEQSLSKASSHKLGGGGSKFGARNAGGNTGHSKSQGMQLGEVSGPPGGWGATARTVAFAGGAIAGGWAGGIATAGLPDLRVTPERAGNFEKARFGVMQAVGDFGAFQNVIDSAKTDFNVQNEQLFNQTLVHGVQRMGMVGMMGGGTVGERKAGQLMGGTASLAMMAGVDQSQVSGMMDSMYGAPAYYNAMAAGIQTRDPVTGELASTESMVNQLWANTGMEGKSGEEALTAIDIDYGVGSMGRAQLNEMFGGDQAAVETFVQGMRLRAQNDGKALEEGSVEEAAREADILGTEKTQAWEAENRLASEEQGLTGEYVDSVTKGMAESLTKVADAVELLAELEGPMRDIVDFYMEMAAELDVFQEETPGMIKGLTDFFGGLPGFILSALGLNSLLKGGGGGGLLGKLAMGAGRLALTNPIGIGVAATAATVWAVNKYGSKEANAEMGTNPDKRPSYLTGTPTSSSSSSTPTSSSSSSTPTPSSSSAFSYTRGYAEGEWNVESDQISRVHTGEMILPNRVASAVREELALGQTSGAISRRSQTSGAISSQSLGDSSRGASTVNIYLTVQRASDQEAMNFASKVKRIIEDDQELLSIGSGRF